jgi:ferrous iron transport protein B
MSCSARLPVYLLLVGAFLGPRWGHAWWVPGLVIFSMYFIGVAVAVLVAFVLKRTLLRGQTPPFVMEMPLYKRPSLRLVVRRAVDSGWMFVRRAGTIILASMIVVWALLYFPATKTDDPQQRTFEQLIALEENKLTPTKQEADDAVDEVVKAWQALRETQKAEAQDAPATRELTKNLQKAAEDAHAKLTAHEEEQARVEKAVHGLQAAWKGQSYLGRAGHAIEPVVEPLGWDWRIGMAALASFPAREVMVGALSIIFGEGEGDPGDEDLRGRLGDALRDAPRQDADSPLFSVPVAVSVMVFFALCCQCVSTLAIIKRETNSWRWPVFTFVYMTALAYLGALLTYQIGSWFV